MSSFANPHATLTHVSIRFVFPLMVLLLAFASHAQDLPSPRPVAEPAVANPDAVLATTRAAHSEQVARARLEQVLASEAAVTEVLDLRLASGEAGELLREARSSAPQPSAVATRVTARERQVAEAKLARVRLLERRRLADDPGEIGRLSGELAKQVALVEAVEAALEVERDLAVVATRLVDLLDEELLWISSAPPIGPAWLKQTAEGLRASSEPAVWIDVGRAALRGLADMPVRSGLVTLLAGGLLLQQIRLRRTLQTLADRVGRLATDSFGVTLASLLVTLLLALPFPLVLLGIGGLLATSDDLFAISIGQGLLAAGAVWWLLGFIRLLCCEGGLADAHFEWDAHARKTLATNLRWLMAVEVPAAFFGASADASGDDMIRQGIGRLAFMIGSIGLTLFVARVFWPKSGMLAHLLHRDGWAWRLRRLWYVALVAIPAALTVAAAIGYVHTAREIQSRFFITGVVVLMGVVLYSTLTRSLLVARRRLAVQQARQKLVDQREARERRDDDADQASGDAIPELDTKMVDVDAASGQTLLLLRIAATTGVFATLWAVWGDVLPALAVLERVELAAPTLDTDGGVIVPAVTLWSLLLAGFLGALTVIAARNLPAVLELAILQRFPIDAGTRYAIVTLTRYVVIAIGIVWASRLLGIDWGKAQWIVAALGVGLGFGLQEIVANFVSGLIILFERPVRVGDVVTVGEISGTVSRLQIRATTITDWDNKEVIVPNKSFITDQVTNWTLSNATTRLLIPIGVAYGSNIGVAHKAITEAVRSVPGVLSEPNPSVLFVSFGDSSLDFEVRAFVADLSKRLPTLHELHIRINDGLAAAGVEIPFPQRDLHLRSSDIDLIGRPTPNSGPVAGAAGGA